MNTLFKYNKQTVLFLLLLFLLSFVCFYQVLSFGMWIDDTHLIWASLYQLSRSYVYYNHPGLPLEFLLLSHFFGTYYVFWQLVNIGVKAIDAFLTGLFVYKLTKNAKVGFLAALFFSVSYAGLEVVDSPIMNIAGIVTIPMLLSLYYFIFFVEEKKYLKRCIALFLLSFVLDPGRMFSVFLIVPFLYILYKNKKQKIQIQPVPFILALSAIILLSIVSFFWFIHFEADSQIAKGLIGLLSHTSVYITKLNRIGNLFGAVGNLFLGYFYPMQQNYQDTGMYQRVFGVVGVATFLLSSFSFFIYTKTKNKRLGIIGFFGLWTFLFYLPNWFSEPRAPMAAPHRYLFLSSIGLICLVAYAISLIRAKWIVFLFALEFMIMNMVLVHNTLSWQGVYRSQTAIIRIWNPILNTIPKGEKHDLLIFSGDDPWLSQDIMLFGADRYLLLRGYTNVSYLPFLFSLGQETTASLCNDGYPLDHIYSWYVESPGIVSNTTKATRILLHRACS